MSDIEIYGKDIARKDEFEFKGVVCPIMSGIGPMCSGSSWIGIACLKEKCMARGYDCDNSECNADFECNKYEESGYDDNVCEGCKHATNMIGFCKLIEGRQ